MRLSIKSVLWLVERFFAAFTLFCLWPAVAFLSLFIRLTGGKPVLVTDEWLSQDGRPLRAYRFRTTGPGQSAFRFVGRIIRQRSMDEIPALWNIACGEVRLKDLLVFIYH